jgi:hypothetical protein
MKIMIRYFFLLVLLLFGFDNQKTFRDSVSNGSNAIVQEVDKPMKKHLHPVKEEPPICENLTVAECLTIIIPAIWDREVEKDCS